MKTVFLTLLVSTLSAHAAEEQISASRVESLRCSAWNAFGTSQFTLEGGTVSSLTNGFIPKSYRLSNLGNSGAYSFGYLNLSSGSDLVSFAFPAQNLRAGEQTVSGVMFLNQALSPFAPVVGMGTPWAQVTCSVAIRAGR